MSNWTEDDHMTPEQEREAWAREECARRSIDPDEICAEGGVEAWMVVANDLSPTQDMYVALVAARRYLGGSNPLLTSGGIKNGELRALIDAALSKASLPLEQRKE